MNRYLLLTSLICLLLGTFPQTGNAQMVFMDSSETVVCRDSAFWVDIRVDSMIDSLHSFGCVIYLDSLTVYPDSVDTGSVFDPFLPSPGITFEWDYNLTYPGSLYVAATIWGTGAFLTGPGQLARMWFTPRGKGDTPVSFEVYVFWDATAGSDPMDVTPQNGEIIVLGDGIRYGDVNDDGTINIGDVVYLVNYLYRNGQEPLPWWFVGTVNCDLVVNIGDIVYLVNYLYRGGEPPCDPCGEE